MASKKTDLDPAVVAEIASKSTKELEAATGMHARAIESIRDAMAEDEDVIAAKAKYDEARAVYQADIKQEKKLLRAHYKELMVSQRKRSRCFPMGRTNERASARPREGRRRRHGPGPQAGADETRRPDSLLLRCCDADR